MKTFTFWLLLLLCTFAFACEKDLAELSVPPTPEAISGKWLVVYQKHKQNNFYFRNEEEGVVSSWGCYYVLSLNIREDLSFFVNDTEKQETNDHSQVLQGNWQLENNQLIFNCQDGISTSFTASMGADGRLRLENNQLMLELKKAGE